MRHTILSQVAGLTKSIFQMVGGIIYFGEVVTALVRTTPASVSPQCFVRSHTFHRPVRFVKNCVGFTLSIIGSLLYAYVRANAGPPKAEARAAGGKTR